MGRHLGDGVGTVWVQDRNGSQMVSFTEGDDIPDWAAKQMGDHCFEDANERQAEIDAKGFAPPPVAKAKKAKKGKSKSKAKGQGASDGDSGSGSDEDGDGESSEEYAGMTVAVLRAEIDRRNDGRDEDQKISRAGNKPDLVAALTADDDESA